MTFGIKEVIALVLVVLAVVGLQLAGLHYLNLRQAAAQNETRGGLLKSASDGIAQGVHIDAAQQTYNQGLAAARAEFQVNQQEAQRHDPQLAARAATAVPDRVRDNFRARRLARERLGCAGSECEEGRSKGDAAQR